MKPQVTLEEFFTLRAESDKRYELIEEEIVLQASPNIHHQRIVFKLAKQFRSMGRKEDM